MTFEVQIAGRLRTVSVEPAGETGPAGGRFRVRIYDAGTPSSDGEWIDVDARPTDLGLSLLYADGRSVDAALTDRPVGELFVQLPHVDLTAVVDGRRFRRTGTDEGE